MSFWFKDTKYGDELRIGRVTGTIILLIVGIITLLSSFAIVPAGHAGIVIKLGAVEQRSLGEGPTGLIPFVEHVQMMEVRTLIYEVKTSAGTHDLLEATTTIAVNYKLDKNSVHKIYQEIGLDYENRVIVPAVSEELKATTANFKGEQLITQRPAVKTHFENALRNRLAPRGIIVEAISLTDFGFPTDFQNAITAKQTAVQLKLKAENDLERIKVEADQAIAVARGQAESIRIINQELQRSPQYVEYLAVQKWNGIMPLVTGSGGMPLITVPTPETTKN